MSPLCPAFPGMMLTVHVPDVLVVWLGINSYLFIFFATGRQEKLLLPSTLFNLPQCLLGIKLLNMRKKSWN